MKFHSSILNDVPDLYQVVYDLTSQIPDGMVTTYGSIAKALGDIKAARAVGEIEHENPRPILVPCHRVVYADGGLSGFGAPGGPATKKKFLEREGITIRKGKIKDFESKLFTDFKLPSQPPLEELRSSQDKMQKMVTLKNDFDTIETVCGIDIAYRGRTAYGAAVVFDYKFKTVVEKVTVQDTVRFPYIPTYLAYRELPVILKLLKQLKTSPTVVLIDGNGILHPRRFGIASHIGVVTDMAVMGAAKKILCGTYSDSRLHSEGDAVPIMLEKKKVGNALLSSPRSKKPVFISPGHKISIQSSLKVARHFTGQRMLTPIKNAHEQANESARNADENI
jgi:deoxyribonuclease V